MQRDYAEFLATLRTIAFMIRSSILVQAFHNTICCDDDLRHDVLSHYYITERNSYAIDNITINMIFALTIIAVFLK